MTYDQFSALVRDMRAAQKEYFETRSKEALNKSKSLEKQVDEAMHKHYNQDTQKCLFDLEPGTPAYVKLDKLPPDAELGEYKVFESEQCTAYVQVLNCGDVYSKTIMKETGAVNTSTYTGEGAKDLLKYIMKRCNAIGLKGGAQ